MFYHPIYIAEYPSCRAAIEEGLRYIKAKNICALHVGNDDLYHWWKARSATRVRAAAVEGNNLRFEVKSNYKDGVIIKVPLGTRTAKSITINGVPSASGLKNERRFGRNWALAVVPAGTNRVKLVLQ
jgi:hypothetical protein